LNTVTDTKRRHTTDSIQGFTVHTRITMCLLVDITQC